MQLRAQNYVLGFAAALCFFDGFLAPKDSDPGPALTAVMGILLVRRAVIITPPVRSCDRRRMCDGRTSRAGQPQLGEHKQTDLDRAGPHRGGMLRPLGTNRKAVDQEYRISY